VVATVNAVSGGERGERGRRGRRVHDGTSPGTMVRTTASLKR